MGVIVLASVRVLEGVEEGVGKRGVGVPGKGENVAAWVEEGTLVGESRALGENGALGVKCTGVPVVVMVDRGWEGVGKEDGVTSSTVSEARGEVVALNGVALDKGEGDAVETTVVPMGVLELEGEREGLLEVIGLEEGVKTGLNDERPE